MKTIPWISENVPSDDYSKLEQVVDPNTGFTIVNIPVGFQLWKGMKKTNRLTSDPLNYRAQQLAWFSTEPVATTYESEVSGDTRKYEFSTLKPLKLLVLLNNTNLKLILKKALKEKYDVEAITAFMATTGMGMTIDEQIEYFKGIREIGTNPIPKAKISIGPGATVGTSKWDIHRVSVHTSTDRLMAQLICNITGLDGYIASNTPTFIINPKYPLKFLQEEIMICKQASNIEVTFGGVIPDFMGYQGYIIMDKSSKVVYKHIIAKGDKHIIEREIVASKYNNIDGLVKTHVRKEECNEFIFMSKLYDTNLEDYLIKNLETITEEKLDNIVNRCNFIFSQLRKHKILHYDASLKNFFVINHKIDLGDYGTTIVLNHNYTEPKNKFEYYKFQFHKGIDKLYFMLNLGIFCSFYGRFFPVFRKYQIEEFNKYLEPDMLYHIFRYNILIVHFPKFRTWENIVKQHIKKLEDKL
jgi:hypothetical protein